MTDRELLQKALDALEEAQSYTSSEIWSPSMTNECAAAAEALRAALAQPKQEEDYDAIANKQLASLKAAAKVTFEDAVVRAVHKLYNAPPKQPEQEIESDRPHVEDDGCPTEKAVLQRFWREHQKQELEGINEVILNSIRDSSEVVAPPQREWVGLTGEEIREFEIWLDNDEEEHGWNPPENIVKYLEAKLKEKNA